MVRYTCYTLDAGGCGIVHDNASGKPKPGYGDLCHTRPAVLVPTMTDAEAIAAYPVKRKEEGWENWPRVQFDREALCEWCAPGQVTRCRVHIPSEDGRNGGLWTCSRNAGHTGPHVACSSTQHVLDSTLMNEDGTYVGQETKKEEEMAKRNSGGQFEAAKRRSNAREMTRADAQNLAGAMREAMELVGTNAVRDAETIAVDNLSRIAKEGAASIDASVKAGVSAIASIANVDSLREMITSLAPRVIEVRRQDGPPIQVDGIEHKGFETLLRVLAAGATRVYLAGPPGWGKTSAAERCARALGRRVFVQTPIADRFEAIGFRDAAGVYQDTELYRWATCEEDGAILILDELDASQPNAALALNAALANGLAVFPHKQVTIPPSHVVIANGNTWGHGATSQFAGRMRQDAAFMRRFPVRMDWGEDEDFELRVSVAYHGGEAKRVRECQRIRANLKGRAIAQYWHPTDTYSYCALRAGGLSHADAIGVSVVASLDEAQRKDALEGVRAC